MNAAGLSLYVPEYPTLYPGMLLARDLPGDYPPFENDHVYWYYFARNAVWNAAKILGLEGGEVLVPSYHHGVEIEALVHAGAKPVFYRVGSRWDVDIADVAARIGPKTRALYLTHYAGFPGPAREMKRLAEDHGLVLIEDCALSLLSSDGGIKLGTIGDASVFCLYKTLPVPNGGALQLNGAHHYDAPVLRLPPRSSVFNHAASSLLKNVEFRAGIGGRWARSMVRSIGHRVVRASQVQRIATGTMHFDPDHVDLGISPLAMRIARAQQLPDIIATRRRNYSLLHDALAELCPPVFENLPAGVCPLFYPLRVKHKAKLLKCLEASGIGAVDFWRDGDPACNPAEFPETVQLRKSIVEIPCHQDLDAHTVRRMVAIVRGVLCDIE